RMIAKLERKELGMLDLGASHVGDVERAVRSLGQVHGTKPLARAREVLAFGERPPRHEGRATALELGAPDEISRRLADEDIAMRRARLLPEPELDAARGGERARV